MNTGGGEMGYVCVFREIVSRDQLGLLVQRSDFFPGADTGVRDLPSESVVLQLAIGRVCGICTDAHGRGPALSPAKEP